MAYNNSFINEMCKMYSLQKNKQIKAQKIRQIHQIIEVAIALEYFANMVEALCHK